MIFNTQIKYNIKLYEKNLRNHLFLGDIGQGCLRDHKIP